MISAFCRSFFSLFILLLFCLLLLFSDQVILLLLLLLLLFMSLSFVLLVEISGIEKEEKGL
jgi:hypothetical protein